MTGLNARIVLPGAFENEQHGDTKEEPSDPDDIYTTNADDMETDEGDSDSDDKDDSSFGHRSDEESEIFQLKEINAELMREVEKLRSQKETLQQQVAVLSEGSSYI